MIFLILGSSIIILYLFKNKSSFMSCVVVHTFNFSAQGADTGEIPWGESQMGLKKSFIKVLLYYFIRYVLHLHFKCYPEHPLYPSPALLPNPPTPTSWPWHSPLLGHMIFPRQRASHTIDSWLGHPLLHMQLKTEFYGVLVSSYCCSTYRVADTFSSLGIFSRSFFGALCYIQ